MSVMSIRIDDRKRKAIKAIASLEGKTISGVIEELIDGYIEDKKNLPGVSEIMRLSESSFMEWDNPEDEIYNDL
jgi:predicted DNA-binding protein